MIVHILHIGKTGGSALKAALRPLNRPDIVLHEHDFTLADVGAGEMAVASVRHPLERFVSGFYSRLRQGRPLYDVPWSPDEAAAFALFQTADALASTLAGADTGRRSMAEAAMRAIAHTRTFLSDWLGAPAELEARGDRLLAVLHQPDLDADFARLRVELGAPHAALPADAVARHATGPEFDTRLGERARAALTEWYADDLRVYAAALDLRERLQAKTPLALTA